MGLLKHAILPLFIVIDLALTYTFLLSEDLAAIAPFFD
jgi:hypothetical protein